jgi:ABC-type sugar transport system ATPase subunit
MAQSNIEMFSVRPAQTEAKIGTLSGGNQQKVALARASNRTRAYS